MSWRRSSGWTPCASSCMRTFPFGSDGNFSNELLIQTINTDLANDLGNLVSRTTAMVQQVLRRARCPPGCKTWDDARGLRHRSCIDPGRRPAGPAMRRDMDAFAPHKALDEVFKVIQRANKYIDENAPWALAKDMEANGARLAHVLYNLLEATRICGILLTPFMPESLRQALCPDRRRRRLPDLGQPPPSGAACRRPPPVTKGENLFPRVDMDKALAELEAAEAAAKKAALPAVELEPQLTEKVDFDTFCKSDFRAVKVKACEAVKKSKKLLTLHPGRRHRHRPADPLRHRTCTTSRRSWWARPWWPS